MLLNFYIDPEAIDDNINRSHINALRNKWQQFGVLAHPSHSDGAFRDLRRRFPHLTQENRRLWNAAWQEIENDPVRFLRCRDNFKIALISERLAGNEQILDGDSKYVRGIEAIRLTQVNDSKEFMRAEDLSKKHIAIGERIVDLWQERFQSLAKHSQDVAIVDQWAVRNNNIQGLLRLLRFLNQDSNGCRITIYSSPQSGSTSAIENIRRRLWYEAARFDIRKVIRIEVRLFDNSEFGLYAHDRHIRFDHRVIGVGRGLDIFNSQRVQRATDTTHTTLPTGAHEYKEESLDKNATRIDTLNIPVGTAIL